LAFRRCISFPCHIGFWLFAPTSKTNSSLMG
jgi:hypothetical protein